VTLAALSDGCMYYSLSSVSVAASHRVVRTLKDWGASNFRTNLTIA